VGLIAPPPTHPRRLVFLGTPDLAVPPLRALVAAGFDVALVVSRGDKRRGRRAQPSASPVKEAALELGLAVSTTIDDVLTVGADLAVVVAFGRLIKPHILAELAMVNLHFSLLPRWRGAAPVERAILAGDPVTGVDLMAVEEGLDTGPVYARQEVDIAADATLASLQAELTEVGTRLLVDTLRTGLTPPQPQVGEATYADRIERSDRELRWDQPAAVLDRIVRVGGAWTTVHGSLLKVHDAEVVDDAEVLDHAPEAHRGPGSLHDDLVVAGSGALRLLEVQPEGRPRLDARAWLNGARLDTGDRLGG